MTTANLASFNQGSFADGAEQGAAAAGQGLRRAWTSYRAYRRTLVELNALTDRQLADIGMERSTLNRIAHAAVHRL